MALLSRVLKPQTADAVEKLGLRAEQIADRWVLGWPKLTKELEASGNFLDRLKAQVKVENEAVSGGRVGGDNSHLTDWELLEVCGISQSPPV